MNEEKYIKDKLSDYQSPMDMDQMWSQLSAGLDGTGDIDEDVDTTEEESHIKEQLEDYESPMDMNAIWSKLDAKLEGNTDVAKIEAKPIRDNSNLKSAPVTTPKEKKSKKSLLLLLLLLLGGSLASYGILNWNSNPKTDSVTQKISPSGITKSTNTTAKETTVPQNRNAKQDASSENKFTTESSSNNKSSATQQELNAKVNTPGNTRNSNNNNNAVAKSTGTTGSGKKAIESNSKTNQGTKAKNGSSSLNKSEVAPPPASTDLLLDKKTNTSGIKPPAQAEINKPIAIKLPVLNNKGDGIYLDDQNVTVNELAVLENNPVLPLQYERASYNPLPVEILRPKSNWRVGMHIGTGGSDVIDEEYRAIRSQLDNQENLTLNGGLSDNIAIGFSLEKTFASPLKISTGLNYFRERATIKNRSVLSSEVISEGFGEEILTYNAEEEVIRITEVERTYRVTYQISQDQLSLNTLQLPLAVGMELSGKRLDFSLSLGAAANYYFSGYRNNSISSITEINSEANISFSRLKFFSIAELQLGYRFSDRFRIYTRATAGGPFGARAGRESNFSFGLDHAAAFAGISYLL